MCGVGLCAIFVYSCVFLEYCGINNDIHYYETITNVNCYIFLPL